MSEAPSRADGLWGGGPKRELHSLHVWRGSLSQDPRLAPPRKADRLLVGVVSAAVLLYLVGRALGLGRYR